MGANSAMIFWSVMHRVRSFELNEPMAAVKYYCMIVLNALGVSNLSLEGCRRQTMVIVGMVTVVALYIR